MSSRRLSTRSRAAEATIAQPRPADFAVLSRSFSVSAPTEEMASAVELVYGELRCGPADRGTLPIVICEREPPAPRYAVSFGGRPCFEAERLGDVLHHLDNQLTIALEHALPGLYFLHAAALAKDGEATLLVGDSGAGKSTTAYALAAAGMDYLSDELAPVDVAAGRVLPYPRAICLKGDPPAPLRVPREHLRTEWTLHVPPHALGCRVLEEGAALRRIVFVRHERGRTVPSLRPVSPGEASLRLYQGALNQLAHPCWGLDETIALVQQAECLELLSAGIEATVELLRSSP